MKLFVMLGLVFVFAGCQSAQVKDSGNGGNDFRETMINLGAKARTPRQEELDKHPLGSRNNPIKVKGHKGREEYLASLVCSNGSTASGWNRVGSVGVGPYGFMMDLYNIICDTEQGVVEFRRYIDMYHNASETRPASGFIGLKQ